MRKQKQPYELNIDTSNRSHTIYKKYKIDPAQTDNANILWNYRFIEDVRDFAIKTYSLFENKLYFSARTFMHKMWELY